MPAPETQSRADTVRGALLVALSAAAFGAMPIFGRYVCKARRPECWHCAIEPLCEYRPKTPPPEL
jgi:endonuclease III